METWQRLKVDVNDATDEVIADLPPVTGGIYERTQSVRGSQTETERVEKKEQVRVTAVRRSNSWDKQGLAVIHVDAKRRVVEEKNVTEERMKRGKASQREGTEKAEILSTDCDQLFHASFRFIMHLSILV